METSTHDTDELLEEWFTQIFNEVMAQTCVPVHRFARFGLSHLYGPEQPSTSNSIQLNDLSIEPVHNVANPTISLATRSSNDAPLNPAVATGSSVDVFNTPTSTLQKIIQNLTVLCPVCSRRHSALKFAPHLERCMGMGRHSFRLATRRNARILNENGNHLDAMRIASLDRLTEQRKKKEMNKYPSQGFDPEFEHSETSDVDIHSLSSQTNDANFSDNDSDWANGFNGPSKRTIQRRERNRQLSVGCNPSLGQPVIVSSTKNKKRSSKKKSYPSSSHKSSSAAPFRTSAMGVEEEEDDDDAAFPPPSIVVDVDTFAFTNDDSASNQESLASQSMDGDAVVLVRSLATPQ